MSAVAAGLGGWGNVGALGLGALGVGTSIAGSLDGKSARERAEREARRMFERQMGMVESAGSVTPSDREAIEAQFGRARESTIASSPARGGQLVQALLGLDTERAKTVGTLGSQARLRALGLALPVMSAGQAGFSRTAELASARETASAGALGQMTAMATLMALKQGQKSEQPGSYLLRDFNGGRYGWGWG